MRRRAFLVVTTTAFATPLVAGCTRDDGAGEGGGDGENGGGGDDVEGGDDGGDGSRGGGGGLYGLAGGDTDVVGAGE